MNTKLFNLVWLFYVIAISSTSAQISIKSNHTKQNDQLTQYLKKYELMEFSSEKSISNHEDEINISVHSDLIGELSINGVKNNVIDDQSHLSMISESGEIFYPKFPVRTYVASIQGDAKSKVHFTTGENYFSLNLKKGKSTYALESISRFTKNNDDKDLILYNINDLLDQEMDICHRADEMVSEGPKSKEENSEEFAKTANCKEMEMLIHADYQLFQKYQYSMEVVAGEIASILNLVNTDYEGIAHQGSTMDLTYHVKNLIVSTCEDCDRWGTDTDIGLLLSNYMDYTDDNAPSDYDMAGLFSGVAFNGSIVGLANLYSTCNSETNNFVIAVNTGDLTLTRGRCTHEIGHSLGCRHNYQVGTSCSDNPNRDNLLMDPWIARDTKEWSNGSQDCANNSQQTLFNSISAGWCLGDCGSNLCGSVTDMTAEMNAANRITINWEGTASEYKITIKDENKSSILYSGNISGNAYTYYGLINLCAPYLVSITPICSDDDGDTRSMMIYSDNRNNSEILRANVVSCTPGNPSTFDLEVDIRHQGGDSKGFDIDVNGQIRHFNYIGGAGSIQTVVLFDLIGTDQTSTDLIISSTSSFSDNCDASFALQIPNAGCDVGEVEKFDFCGLPEEWSKTTTNTLPYSNPFEWKFADSNREILNYGNGSNANTTKTINGSCMAYFDDDINTSPNYTGNISLQSKIFDFTQYQDLSVKFLYNFHSFQDLKGQTNNSEFSFEVFDGYNWVELYRDNQDKCVFTEVWSEPCLTEVSINLANYNNSFLRVRFNYTDGGDGDWAGMIALDEFEIMGSRGAVLPVQIENFEANSEEKEIELVWESFDEVGIAHYSIEKFDEPTQEFKFFMNVVADNTKYTKYHIYDDQPTSGENLYRLTAVSDDNQKMNSNLAATYWTGVDQNEIAVFPNPVSQDFITIKSSEKEEENEYSLLDLNGKLIQKLATHQSDIKFRLDNVLPGTYMLQVKTESGIKNHKIVRL